MPQRERVRESARSIESWSTSMVPRKQWISESSLASMNGSTFSYFIYTRNDRDPARRRQRRRNINIGHHTEYPGNPKSSTGRRVRGCNRLGPPYATDVHLWRTCL